jgi:selenocysteine lyase/cysteine desulfurase
MIYLDNGATTLHKPPAVKKAMLRAMDCCGNPGRGGHPAAMEAAKVLYDCREAASRLFHCSPEQVVLTGSCTHGLNMAIGTLVEPGDPVVISGFEHNAVRRPLHAVNARITVAGRRLFDWDDTLIQWEKALKKRPKAAIFTHCSNVFGYVLPVRELAGLCAAYGVPFILDAAQTAGSIPLDLPELGAAFIAMPGHKGLLGPMGTGLLLCSCQPKPLLFGGTGSESVSPEMPSALPERAEPGTANVPGAAGLTQGLNYLLKAGPETVGGRERQQADQCIEGLTAMGIRVLSGPHRSGTFSILPKGDCEEAAAAFSEAGIALRAGLHCAPLAHESAGTLETGTLRVSFGPDAAPHQTQALLRAAKALQKRGML